MEIKKRCKGKSIRISKHISKKRAQHPATMIFYYTACFLFAGFVAYTYIKIAYVGAKSTEFQMEYHVNDIGLMTDAIYAVPGDVRYDYRKDPSKFIVDFRENNLLIYTVFDYTTKPDEKHEFTELSDIELEESRKSVEEVKLKSPISVYYYLFRGKNPFIRRFMFPVMLSFKKTGSILEVSSSGTFKEEEHCPSIDTAADIKEKSIFIEPGHSAEKPGYETSSIKEFELTGRIAESLRVLCQSHSLKCTILAQEGMAEKMKKLRAAKPDLVLSIHIGKYNNPEDRPFRAMVPIGDEKSSKLACIISNRFRKDYVVLDRINVDLGKISSDDYRAILSKTVPSAILEIGNINNPYNFDQNSDTNEIADRIMKGLEDYYGKIKPEIEEEPEKPEPQKMPQKTEQEPERKVKTITR